MLSEKIKYQIIKYRQKWSGQWPKLKIHTCFCTINLASLSQAFFWKYSLTSVRSTFWSSKALGKDLALGISLGFIFADEVLTLQAIVLLHTIQVRISERRSRKGYFQNGVIFFSGIFLCFSLFPFFFNKHAVVASK